MYSVICRDYEDFLQDLEEDPTYREGVNIYKDRSKIKADVVTEDEGEGPRISLEEMLDDLTLSEAEGDPDWVDMDDDDE
jgi:nonsense-mediated mRNA decay protein 3